MAKLLPALTVCALVVALGSTASAQPVSHLQAWTTENGLPQNSVNDILQTRDGYLWLATFGGLVRFDGVRFVVFDRNVDGILSQRLWSLFEDADGTLWAGGEDGILIQHRNGRFKTFTTADGLPPLSAARRIEADQDQRLWITWQTNVVTRFDGQRFVNNVPADFALQSHFHSETAHRELWWRQDDDRVHAFVHGVRRTYTMPAALANYRVTGANADRYGNVWIRTNGAGVLQFAGDRFERYSTTDGLPTDAPDGVFYADRNGAMWFGERRGPIYRISHGKRERVDRGSLYAFYEDREGSIWFGTSTGLRRVRTTPFRVYTERDGLSINNVYSILETRSGVIWVGTWDGGLNKLSAGRFSNLDQRHGLPSHRITSLFEDRGGVLWVGTTAGLGHVESDRFTPYADRTGWLGGAVWAVCQDRAGAYWFGTDNGLVKLVRGELSRYTTKDGLAHDRVFTLYEDRHGVLWAGGAQGLTRLQNGVFRAYGEHDGLIGNQVRAIHEDRDGVLWIGTYDGGLYRLANDRLTRYTRETGMHDNGVFQILEDDNHFWMGSNRGISRVSRHHLNDVAEGRRGSVVPMVFDPADGLISSEVNGMRQPAGMKAADGTLWFPTMGGVAVIDPKTVVDDTPAVLPIIEEVRLAGRPTRLSGALSVPSDVTAFEIQYTAASFVKPEQLRFRYRLIGLDEEWVDAGNRRVASFYRIPPGTYRFAVMASNHKGTWTGAAHDLEIVVAAPFWRSWWFTALVAAAVVSAALTGHARRLRRLRGQQSLRAAFTQQLIDSQERERQRVAREMHDSFGHHAAVIRARAQAAAQWSNSARVSAELDEITGLAEQMKSDMHAVAYGLHPCQLEVIGLSRTLENLVTHAAAAGRVRFTADVADIDRFVARDSGIHIYRIVQEGVSNILAHSGATMASVAIARENGDVHIRIEDNGLGLGLELSPGARRTGKGFGLMGIEERARLLGGTMQIASTCAGTTITVRVPIDGAAHT